MKFHHVNRAYFAQQIVRCVYQKYLVKESKHGSWMKAYKLQNIKYVDMNLHI